MTELKPCPFCGPVRDQEAPPFTWLGEFGEFRTSCAQCGADGPTAGTEEDAGEYWNDRKEPVK